MKELIKQIHESDIYGIFAEAGGGVPVASSLFDVSGASKTVYFTVSPYSREFYNSSFNPSGKVFRSVSPEYVSEIINNPDYLKLLESGKINTVFASTFQVGENNTKSTHGWISLRYKETLYYYHISIHEPLSRTEYINRIGENAIKLINAKNKEVPEDCDVDIVLDKNFKPDFTRTMVFIANLRTKEQFSIFSKDRIERLESITRENQALILFKGNFNPVQNAHINIINESKKLYPEAEPYFMISFNAVQKGKQNTESVLSRMNLLFELGYKVIICNNPFFRVNVALLRNKFSGDKKIILAMGLDTLNRLLPDYTDENGSYNMGSLKDDFNNVKFVCLNRAESEIPDFLLKKTNMNFNFITSEFGEVSSTKIRELLEQKNLEEVKKIVPEKVYKLIIDKKWKL